MFVRVLVSVCRISTPLQFSKAFHSCPTTLSLLIYLSLILSHWDYQNWNQKGWDAYYIGNASWTVNVKCGSMINRRTVVVPCRTAVQAICEGTALCPVPDSLSGLAVHQYPVSLDASTTR